MSDSNTLEPEVFSATERASLREHLARLREVSRSERPRSTPGESSEKGFLRIEGEGGEETVPLPDAFLRAIARALTDVAEGRAVSVSALDEELTTREAADLLNVSRPYLTGLLKDGKIPHRKVGTHRRVRRRDVLIYKEKMRADSEEAMQELADQAQELGLGYE